MSTYLSFKLAYSMWRARKIEASIRVLEKKAIAHLCKAERYEEALKVNRYESISRSPLDSNRTLYIPNGRHSAKGA